jgi:hypothetical protein
MNSVVPSFEMVGKRLHDLGDKIEHTIRRTKMKNLREIVFNEEGRVGYLVAWLLGVPSSLLLLIFLIRGH